MKITIKNFVGISRAEIDVDGGIILVGGDNAVGKSSVIRGVQTLLTGELVPKGVTKGGSQALVMDGKKGGQLQLINGEASISVAYPDPQYVTQGEAPSASRLAAGLQRYTDMSDGERSIFLTALLHAYPTLIQLNSALKDDLELPADAVAHISTMVGSRGWDEAVVELSEKRVKLKGRWEQVTGQRWGDKKAVDWRPEDWLDSLDEATQEQVDLKVNACQEAYDRAAKAATISEAEHKSLREIAGKREPVEMSLQTLRGQLPSIEADWASLRRELDALPPAVDDAGIPCPHCGAHVRVIGDNTGERVFRLVPVEPLLEGEVERRKRAIAEKKEAVREAHQRLEAHQQEIGTWEEKLRRAMEAAAMLKVAKVNGNGKAEGGLLLQLEAAKRQRDLWKQRQEAAELQLRVEAHQAVIDLLGPRGMRRTSLLAALAKFERDNLEPLSSGGMATWKPVTIDRETLLPLFGGRPYSLLSKSEQYRTDVTMQIAIALLEGAAMVCIDGADILSHDGQDDLLLALLDKLPFPVIVGATYSRPKACPNLDHANIGHSYWVNAGKLMPLAEALT